MRTASADKKEAEEYIIQARYINKEAEKTIYEYNQYKNNLKNEVDKQAEAKVEGEKKRLQLQAAADEKKRQDTFKAYKTFVISALVFALITIATKLVHTERFRADLSHFLNGWVLLNAKLTKIASEGFKMLFGISKIWLRVLSVVLTVIIIAVVLLGVLYFIWVICHFYKEQFFDTVSLLVAFYTLLIVAYIGEFLPFNMLWLIPGIHLVYVIIRMRYTEPKKA